MCSSIKQQSKLWQLQKDEYRPCEKYKRETAGDKVRGKQEFMTEGIT